MEDLKNQASTWRLDSDYQVRSHQTVSVAWIRRRPKTHST